MSLHTRLVDALQRAGVCGSFSIVALEVNHIRRQIEFSTMPLKVVNTSALARVTGREVVIEGDKVVIR